jgi:signal transduction histidine kinase
MGQRTASPAGHSERGPERVYRQIAQDAARVSGSRLVQLVLVSPGSVLGRSVAIARAGLPQEDDAAITQLLASPTYCSVGEALEGEARRRRAPRLGPCEPELARALGAPPGLLHTALVPVRGQPGPLGVLRFVVEGRPDRRLLRVFRAVAREVSGRLESEALRRDRARRLSAQRRERRTLEELRQAKETVTALNLAGTHLMVETNEEAIFGVICRELLRLGFHSAVLCAERAAERGAEPRPPYRFAGSSFSGPLQRATEKVLGTALADLRVDPATAPLVRRAAESTHAIRSDRARDAARQIFGATDDQLRRLERLLGLRHVLVAPLRYDGGVAALLVVASKRLRRSDPEAIDAFALQASIALEKARLFAELRAHQARLESEVQRRTRELTLAVKALEEIDRRKDNFLANVSHELRTPLVTVLGYTDLVLSEKLGELAPRQRDCLRVVSGSARRLRSFIDELLEYSRYELTKDGLTFTAFDVREALGQAVLALAPRFAERRLRIRARVARGTPRVWADKERLHQVLMNLVTNAERHCRDGGRVLLAAAPVAGRIEVSVADDGQGIPPEHLERIFDRLYQVGDAVRHRDPGAGLGLGLAIAKSIVEAHGGAISVRSRPGRGATFRFSLPVASTSRDAPVHDLNAARPAAARSSSIH